MPIPTDPLLAQQWHLRNSNPNLLDLNVFEVWNSTAGGRSYTGTGVRTLIIDDGFDYTHADFANYNLNIDFDLEFDTNDPFGSPSESHGTAVAGIIGAAANGTGAVGVAFNTQMVGYRTAGLLNDAWLQDIVDSINFAATAAMADVANISQAISNDANSEFGVGYNAIRFDEIEASIATAVTSGRAGFGMTIVKSAGNARDHDFDVNADDWTNDTRQVVVAAVDQDGFVSSYSSYGAAILVSAFGTPGQVFTTDRVGAAGSDPSDFTSNFNGTSAAAPMVAGVVALMYEAAPELGWRDVQSILAASARQVGSEVGAGTFSLERFAWQWTGGSNWNGGGMHFSNDYGYGLVDALAAVRLAETWQGFGLGPQTSSNEVTNVLDVLNVATSIPDGNTTGLTFSGSGGFDDLVERVTVAVTLSTTFMGDLEIYLTSPDGTISQLIADTGNGNDFNGTWTFETQAFRGEHADGTWTVRVVDDAGGDVLNVSDIVITTHGTFRNDDRYVFTNEYSDYAGVAGHLTAISDSDGGFDIVNAAAVSSASVIRLDGVAGTIDGVTVSFANVESAIGGDGADRIIGNTGDNELHGMRGNDNIFGISGTDTMVGGAGNDLYTTDGGDSIIESAGNGTDTVRSSVSHSLGANLENLILSQTSNSSGSGNSLANTLTGNVGNNTLNGRLGADTMLGGAGNDTYVVDAAGDRVFETTTAVSVINAGGTDTVVSSVTFNLDATAGVRFVERLTLSGTANTNGSGNALANTLAGNTGNNALNGGRGNDILLGGAGNDSFVFSTPLSAANIDRITDYNVAADTMRLDDLVFAGLSTGLLGASAFAVNLTGAATDALDRIIYESDTGRLFFDADGSAAGLRVQFAVLAANLSLTHSDFVVF